MGTSTSLVTFEEFERMADEPCKLELMDGEVVRMPPAETRHMRIAQRIYRILDATLQELHGKEQALNLGEVFIETGYHMGANWLIPDVSVSYAGQIERKYLESAPALAIEVISEANTAQMMHRKVRKYIDNGSKEVWLFYPETASVTVYRGKTAVEVEGALISDLLPGVSIDLDAIFAT
jgi:Uma2 family endonuclease